jgi:hypothetical protein
LMDGISCSGCKQTMKYLVSDIYCKLTNFAYYNADLKEGQIIEAYLLVHLVLAMTLFRFTYIDIRTFKFQYVHGKKIVSSTKLINS